VAGRGVLQATPFNAVLWLAGWLDANAGYAKGRLLRDGVRLTVDMDLRDVLDIAHSLVADGVDAVARAEMEKTFEEGGHLWRQDLDPGYKRRTWGMRPDDTAGVMGLVSKPKD